MSTPSDKAKSLEEILAEMQAVADAATEGPWTLEHNDKYVSGPTIGGDWDWIVGSMYSPDDGYNAETTDEDMRGKNIQNNCRFIAQSREAYPRLIECVRYLLPKYADLALAHDEFTIEESHEAINAVTARLTNILQGRG